MSTSTVISSVESIPLPTAAPQVRRPARNPVAAQPSQALDSNASENQSLVPDKSIDGEYVDTAESVERKVEPISRAILSNPDTTMEQLHEMATHELDVLDALNNEGRQIIKMRLMAIWEEMSVRFERGESINGISGTGGKGMGKYLRSIGVDPAKRRYWKFEIRQQEALRLAQENPPSKSKRTTKKEIIINSETEADLIAKAGVRMAQKLVGDGMAPPQERVNSATATAKEILEAIADGQYERLEPLPVPTGTLVPENATFEDWQKHQLPTPQYKLKYFKEATENFSRGYMYSFQKGGFKKIIEVLRDKPEQVLANATDFVQLATVLRGVAENANLLAAAISTALTPSPAPETPQPEEQPEEQNADPADSDPNDLTDDEDEDQTSELDSPTPAAKPAADVVSTTRVGDKSEPTPHGFYFEMRLHDKLPYVVRDTNNPHLGILCECKNKADAEMKVATYEREAAEATKTALDGAVAPQEEHRKRGKRLASKNGGTLGSAAYNPPTNGASDLKKYAVSQEDPDRYIKVELTKAQMRETQPHVPAGVFMPTGKDLRFPGATYQEKAKQVVEALEARIKALVDETNEKIASGELAFDLLDFTNKSLDAIAAKKEKARLQGAIKACEGAIQKIISGDLDSDSEDGRDLYDWSNARDDAKWKADMDAAHSPGGAAEPVTKVELVVNEGTAETEELSWAQKVLIPDSPERLAWSAEVAYRREHPACDPNEGDEFEGEGD